MAALHCAARVRFSTYTANSRTAPFNTVIAAIWSLNLSRSYMLSLYNSRKLSCTVHVAPMLECNSTAAKRS